MWMIAHKGQTNRNDYIAIRNINHFPLKIELSVGQLNENCRPKDGKWEEAVVSHAGRSQGHRATFLGPR